MSDLGFAAQLAEDLSPDDLRMVLSVFRTDVERLTATLAGAAQDGDPAAFRRAAHGLAGAAGAVGAVALERACRAGMSAEMPLGEPMAEIGRRAESALAELGRILPRLGGPP